jgi:AraC-like DNA-binding protein
MFDLRVGARQVDRAVEIRGVGYDSDASFSKAFSRAFGRSPGDYRRDRFAAPTLADHSDR